MTIVLLKHTTSHYGLISRIANTGIYTYIVKLKCVIFILRFWFVKDYMREHVTFSREIFMLLGFSNVFTWEVGRLIFYMFTERI